MTNFKDLEVWEWAYMLNLSVYDLTRDRPGLARKGLAPQMERAATDIASSIARGCGTWGNAGARRWYFNAAMGSAASLEYLVLLAFALRLIPGFEHEWFTTTVVEIQKLLRAALEEKGMEKSSPASVTLVQ
jgi:four helix bundle protein